MKSLFELMEPVQIVDNRPVLMDIQTDLLDRGRVPYSQGARRVLWQAACGSGKTVVASEQTRRALEVKDKTVLHIVHRRRLVDQMVGMLLKFGIESSPIMEGRQRWASKVYCASRDTLLSMLKDGAPLPRCDLICWDEAHVAATELQAWYLKECPLSYWTGYTATPVRPNGDSLSPPYQALVCMKPASELMRIGRLCPVKVYDPKAVQKARKRGEKTKVVGDPVLHWRKYADGLATVVFAPTVRKSKEVCELYNAAGISAEHIDANTNDDDREKVFERSQTGQTKVICNCGVLIEGLDLPWLTCCQILRGCRSLVLWVQACGRVMRAFEGKSHGVILDHAGAVYDYGPPDSDYVWTLEDGAVNERKNKPDRKPIACTGCGFVFSGKPRCPQCGKMLPKRKQSVAEQCGLTDGILTEFVAGQESATAHDAMTRLWKKCLFTGRAKGWRMGQVAGMFSRNAKMPPWEAGLRDLPRGKEGWQITAQEWIERSFAH